MTKIAAPIMVHSLDQALAAAVRASEHGADLVEFRVDRVAKFPKEVIKLIDRSALPCIITCRPTWEGGYYEGDDQARIAMFKQIAAGASQPAYIDIELAAYLQSVELRRQVDLMVDHPSQSGSTTTGLILSSHDFGGRPADLYQRVEAMAGAQACRVMKIVWRARSLRDNIEAFEIIANRHKPTIALCMGEAGLPSRVLAKKFNALLTFAATELDGATAEGQPTIEELKHLYRWDTLNSNTNVYGVIGCPVSHSMGPAIHNAALDAAGYDGVYLPLPIPPEYEHFKATVSTWLDAKNLNFCGASVTIPHKKNLLRFVEQQGGTTEPLTQQIGAANTLTRGSDGQLSASNTDYPAALDTVCHGMGIQRSDLAGLRVAVIGAGGVARAIVAGLAHYGATVVIYNRTIEKARLLADRFNGSTGQVIAAKLEKLCGSCCQVFINCTSVGMYPNTDALPWPSGDRIQCWGADTIVFDTVYNPIQTKLLREAKTAGCVTISGLEMFVRQAALQFELWTGRSAPIDVFPSRIGSAARK